MRYVGSRHEREQLYELVRQLGAPIMRRPEALPGYGAMAEGASAEGWDAKEAILAAPARSRCDLIAKTAIIGERHDLYIDVGADIALLSRQIGDWKRAEPIIWP